MKQIWIYFRPLDMICLLFETNYLWKKCQAAAFFACPIPHTLLTAAWKPFSTLFTVRSELKMAFFFLYQGLFWHRFPPWQNLSSTVSAGCMFVTVICNGPSLGKFHLFFCGTATANEVFCKILAANEPTSSGYLLTPFSSERRTLTLMPRHEMQSKCGHIRSKADQV